MVSDISAVAEFNSMSDKSCEAVKRLLERTEGSEKEELENHLKQVSEHLREWPNDSWIYSDDNSEVVRLPDRGYTVRRPRRKLTGALFQSGRYLSTPLKFRVSQSSRTGGDTDYRRASRCRSYR